MHGKWGLTQRRPHKYIVQMYLLLEDTFLLSYIREGRVLAMTLVFTLFFLLSYKSSLVDWLFGVDEAVQLWKDSNVSGRRETPGLRHYEPVATSVQPLKFSGPMTLLSASVLPPRQVHGVSGYSGRSCVGPSGFLRWNPYTSQEAQEVGAGSSLPLHVLISPVALWFQSTLCCAIGHALSAHGFLHVVAQKGEKLPHGCLEHLLSRPRGQLLL